MLPRSLEPPTSRASALARLPASLTSVDHARHVTPCLPASMPAISDASPTTWVGRRGVYSRSARIGKRAASASFPVLVVPSSVALLTTRQLPSFSPSQSSVVERDRLPNGGSVHHASPASQADTFASDFPRQHCETHVARHPCTSRSSPGLHEVLCRRYLGPRVCLLILDAVHETSPAFRPQTGDPGHQPLIPTASGSSSYTAVQTYPRSLPRRN